MRVGRAPLRAPCRACASSRSTATIGLAPARCGELHDVEADAADAEHHDRLADLDLRVVVDDAGRGRHRAAEQRRDLEVEVGRDRVMRFSETTAYSLKVVTQPALSFWPRQR